ncbi:N-acetylglucosamine-6-phosphate deacetylase [Raineyella sp. W15-4]|uniref:N-acetylglucosamine-6-phosphate deacetylase n=1 Tax=Raineyella sp. W15-4 TaxID=3081651 RepID=UPI002955053B|nr:N-acetylglucosamine-6-phosphate deacetylase [Raineyella sp. W15-4]WOQ16919.1 N-acetylglucosamine-6-phosphate deacetylase [Raineyella sp. W15-4]
MTTIFRAARVLTPEPLEDAWVRVEGEQIAEVGTGPVPDGVAPGGPAGATPAQPAETRTDDRAEVVDLGDRLLVPGFVDIHAHGGGGAAYTDGAEAARTALATHLAHGTTSAMASLVTDAVDVLERQVRALVPLVRDRELLGIHLEGPWLSELHCGAHDPDLLRDPVRHDVDQLLAAGEGTIRMVTLAVELLGGVAAVRHLVESGVVVAPGHSHATYADANLAIDAGARVATHLFNAERPIHHREPGLIVALLERPEVVVEMIADGVHLHPAMVGDIARLKPRQFVLVTDAMAAAGSDDGDYELGPLKVEVRGGVARLAGGGAIAGSTLTLDRAVRFCVEHAGIDLVDAVRAATLTPASVFGREDIGRIAPGAYADLVVLGPDLGVEAVYRCGRQVR